MHLAPLIRDLAVILAVAGIVTLLFQRIRQPVVLGYIIAGAIIGPHTPPVPLVSDLPNIQTWAELGVIFLMFSLGLEFSFRKLARVGLSSGLTAGVEVFSMLLLGFGAAKILGWSTMDAMFLGAMLSISSTTIIIKALDELGLKTRRFAEMIFGVLIVEDLAAILILVALSTIAGSATFSGMAILTAAAKLVLVIGSWFLAGYFLVPRFVKYVGRYGNNEMLTVVSIALCLGLVVFSAHFHYSSALGAFIMGSILAESSESYRIEELIQPLRDLFAAIFFVSVGMLIDPRILWDNLGAIALISLVTIIGKILSTTLGALMTGQTLRTSVQVGFGLAQIGEFSFIIASLGLSLKVISPSLYPIGVAVSLVTTFTTPYLIRISHKFAVSLESRLPLRVRSGLNRYAVWTQERRADTGRRKEFYGILVRWFLNGLITTVIFTLVRELAAPMFSAVLGWVVATLLSAPFIWGMFGAFRGFRLGREGKGDQPPEGGTLLVTQLLTVIWVGLLSAEYLPVKFAALMTAFVLVSLIAFFYRRLQATYDWFERRFMSTFQPSTKSFSRKDPLRGLAPWDAHLVRIKVHPNSDFVLKTISETRLRNEFGLNIVAIQRGIKTVIAPKPSELLLPKDELLVLGTDEQVESVRLRIEKPPGLEERDQRMEGYELRQLTIEPGSPTMGASIRESKIRESFGAMVVGVERSGRRIINPDSDMKLEACDVLWTVGEKEGLDRLEQQLEIPESQE